MRRLFRFIAALVVGLAFAGWLVSALVVHTTHAWFEKDVRLRAGLAVSGALPMLVAHWHERNTFVLHEILSNLTRDERIVAAAACTQDSSSLVYTENYPEQFACPKLGARVQWSTDLLGSRSWYRTEAGSGSHVHVSAIPVSDGEEPLGFVVLLHDLGFVERRESTTQWFLWLVFCGFGVVASVVTVIAARMSWYGWSDELRKFLRGGPKRPQFQPILQDVRELVERIISERDDENLSGRWTPLRLKQTLSRYLNGERVIILANREPYIHERTEDGGVTVVHPASGLVTALEPVMRACSGTWIAHGSGSADRSTADRHGRIAVPPGEESYFIRRVWLTPEEERGYYYGFANEGLWPLCHLADAHPTFRSDDWKHYQTVNRRFACAVREEVDSEDPIILVQDYHFALAPRLIREQLPRATVIMFWHVPWPNSQRFGICPWRKELLEGMLGASMIGFHTQYDCNNFIAAIDQILEARVDREQNAVLRHGRSTLVRAYPISLEWPNRWAAATPSATECRAQVLNELGLSDGIMLGVGVDRMDYTKGIAERFMAVERLLERFPAFRGKFTFIQLGAPSRMVIERYRQLNERVEHLADRINARFGHGNYRPILMLREHHEPSTVFRYYRAANLCYVSSLHDGMNLVAKEFVAARDDEQGVLLLSQFTGAARELTEALIVNPYDLDEASAALATALEMSVDEQGDRMRSMRAFLAEFNVYRWAGRMLVDAARLRRRDRLNGRLTSVS